MKKLSILGLLAAIAFGIVIMTNTKNSPKQEDSVLVDKPLDGAKTPEPIAETSIEVSEEEITTEKEPMLGESASAPKVNEAPTKKINTPKVVIDIAKLKEMAEQYPEDATAQFKYGKACSELGQDEDAVEALKKAEELGYKNLGNLYYELAYALMEHNKYVGGEAYDYFEKARENGFRNYRKFLYAPKFVEMQKENDWSFVEIFQELFGDNKKAMFKAFVLLGPEKTDKLSYDLDAKTLFSSYNKEARENHPRINGYFDDFADGVGEGMFSRGGGNRFRYEMVAQHTKNYITVIYSEEVPWADDLRPRSYHLVTFSPEGEKIDEMKIAERRKLNRCKTVKIEQDQTIAITEQKVRWKEGWKDEGDLDYDNVKYTKAISTDYYMISENGKIVETDPISIGMAY
ncbi:MAG: hypothetical protein GY810_20390 [Aureispira sp.]|nr:hypothetical protein [Aureispira sp.]